MNKLKIISLAAGLVLAMVFTFSCSSDDGEGGGSTPGSSSSGNQSLSSSSAYAPSSSSSIESLACGIVPASEYATRPITPPALTCSSGETATDIIWLGSPDWDSPEEGTYSDISVTADCGTVSSLTASCSGTLEVQPMISCDMINIGYEGTAIDLPVLACEDGSIPSDVVFSGSLPSWDNPISGNYEVFAEADCGFGALPAISCGTLKVNEVTLSCGSVPASGQEGTAITPPALTCNHGTLGVPIWENSLDWSNPAPGTYSDISVTADCGLITKTANCSGSLRVSPSITHGGQTYKTVVIGTQTWMAENLNYPSGNSACYNNQASNCTTYGRLYDWATAMNLASSCNTSSCSNQIQTKHRGICPVGWHIPSDAELSALVTAVGGSSTAGTKLKATSGWNSYNDASGDGTDTYGFSALPGGYGHSSGSFYYLVVGSFGGWWSAPEYGASRAYGWRMIYSGADVFGYHDDKSNLYSVRCAQD